MVPAASFISGAVLRVDGARPQLRMGWPSPMPGEEALLRDAVRPFEGFHRAVAAQVFPEGAEAPKLESDPN